MAVRIKNSHIWRFTSISYSTARLFTDWCSVSVTFKAQQQPARQKPVSGTRRMHLDAITVHFPHEELRRGCVWRGVCKKNSNSFKARRLCNGLIKASASAAATATAAAAICVQNSIPFQSRPLLQRGWGGTHVHLNGSAIIPLLAPHLRRVRVGAEATAACKVGCKVVILSRWCFLSKPCRLLF